MVCSTFKIKCIGVHTDTYIYHCCRSAAKLGLTLFGLMDCNTPGFPALTNSWSLLKLISLESVMPSIHLILCCPLFLLSSIFPRVFSNELALCIRWLKYWSFSFSISPSNEYSGLISFRIDWYDLLAVQGTLKSLPQDHNSEALILQHSGVSCIAGRFFTIWATREPQPYIYIYINIYSHIYIYMYSHIYV